MRIYRIKKETYADGTIWYVPQVLRCWIFWLNISLFRYSTYSRAMDKINDHFIDNCPREIEYLPKIFKKR